MLAAVTAVIDALPVFGTGIVLVEQNLKVPMKLAHRQYVLDHGQVVWSGTAQELDAQRAHVEGLITTGAAT